MDGAETNLVVDIPPITVRNPFTGETVAVIPAATPAELESVLAAAVSGAAAMAALAAYERAELLERAADLLAAEADEIAELIVAEQGKTIAEARIEANRAPQLLRLCAGEALRIHGETLPLDASPNGHSRLGFTLRVPAGIVLAITPFNYPLLLATHKIGPALAAGNSVILKPASTTPLTALRLVGALTAGGFPEHAIQCVVATGATIGPLCSDDRVRVLSFTGSQPVGVAITHVAGIKRLCLELGANCPLVVMEDADIEAVAAATAASGYANAGQVCISTQRVVVHERVYGDYLDALVPKVAGILAGDPASDRIQMGPLISEGEAQRVDRVVRDAAAGGANILVGGERDGALYAPTVVADVRVESELFLDELFGPCVAVTRAAGFEQAIELANRGVYGLGAAIFTRDIDRAIRFARQVIAGQVQINSSPLWRVDGMPYGGLRQSGLGKEGPRYAVEEMTDVKTVVVHPTTPA